MFGKSEARYFLSAACLMFAQPLFVSLSKDQDGKFPYSVPSSIVISECLKLAWSASCVFNQIANGHKLNFRWGHFCAYVVPSGIYCLNNNVQYTILQHVSLATFQMFSQSKTLFTGLLSWVILNRRIMQHQWLALVVLTLGTAISLSTCDTYVRLEKGILYIILTSFSSSVGGVYNEYLLKCHEGSSIHWDNCQMYIWGTLLGVFVLCTTEQHAQPLQFGFYGYCSIMCNAMTGLSVASLLKHVSSVARVYAHSAAMVLTLVVSIGTGTSQYSIQIIEGAILVICATLQYNISPPSVQEEEEQLISTRS